jgi:hypothetical protein
MTEADLLNKLEAKYERPSPGPCCVCGGDRVIDHRGGGLPLKWVCAEALKEAAAGVDAEGAREHVHESTMLDYRKVGDARVMQLIRMYRELRARMPDVEAGRELEFVAETV